MFNNRTLTILISISFSLAICALIMLGIEIVNIKRTYNVPVQKEVVPLPKDVDLNSFNYITLSGRCFVVNVEYSLMAKMYDGECGSPSPTVTAEVTITSDDVLNAIAGKKLKFITEGIASAK